MITPDAANLSALKSLSMSPSMNGQLLYMAGYTSAGDGGGGFFLVTTTSPGADNGGTVIHSNTNGYYFIRQFSEPLNVLWFGADSTGSALSTTAFDNALATGRTVFVPFGVFKVDAGHLTVSSGQYLVGDGLQSTVIKSTSAAGAIVTIGTTAQRADNCGVRDLTLLFDTPLTPRNSGQICLLALHAGLFDVSRIYMNLAETNLYIKDCLIYSVNDCSMYNARTGVILEPTTYQPQHNLAQFNRCRVLGSTGQAFVADTSGSPHEFNQLFLGWCEIESNGTASSGLNVCSFTGVGRSGVAPGVTLQNCWFEGNEGLRDVYFQGVTNTTGISVRDCSFYSTAVTTANVEVVNGQVSIEGCGLNASGPSSNLVLGTNTTGFIFPNIIGALSNSGSVITIPKQGP